MPFVKSEIVIKGEKQKIFDVIQDMASYPKFMKNLVSVDRCYGNSLFKRNFEKPLDKPHGMWYNKSVKSSQNVV